MSTMPPRAASPTSSATGRSPNARIAATTPCCSNGPGYESRRDAREALGLQGRFEHLARGGGREGQGIAPRRRIRLGHRGEPLDLILPDTELRQAGRDAEVAPQLHDPAEKAVEARRFEPEIGGEPRDPRL